MREPFPTRSEWRASNRRVLLAGVLGHYAAACCFCACTMLAGFVFDLRAQGVALFAHASVGRAVEIAWTAPVVTALLGLWGAIIIGPSLLITVPITGWAARKLDADALPTAAIGILPGLLVGLIVFGLGPQIEPSFLVSSAAGGMTFAWVVWLVCIRPHRMHR